MVGGQPGPRGGYNIVRHPTRFANRARYLNNVKHTATQVTVFDDISAATESDPYSVNRTQSFSVQTLGTIVVEVQASNTPDDNTSWFVFVTTGLKKVIVQSCRGLLETIIKS